MSKPLIEKEDFYFNEEGLMVLTRQYLLNRGFCCGDGCYNCPYNYEAVAEPRRSFLLEQKKFNNGGNPRQ